MHKSVAMMQKETSTLSLARFKMPIMPRRAGKPSKIVFAILGKPLPLQDKKTTREKERTRQLIMQIRTREQ